MKRTILFSLLLSAGVLFISAQTQRMVMYEGFSNASCAPCASANPGINTLLFANPTKVVPIKYQVNWPGSDPMNAQTQTWVAPRVTYYGVNAVPATRVDGTGTSLTQTVIDTRYAVPSPFYLTISHSFNETLDSINVNVIVKAAQDFTGSNLVLQVAMVEKHIAFESPAGSNGETNFYNVMRKMIPSSTGTVLQSSWLTNDSVTFSFDTSIPNFIYNYSQLAFVAFIQSNTDKTIHQAAKNDPLPISLYPKIIAHTIPSEPLCEPDLNASFTVLNDGVDDITSINLQYGVVGETPLTYQWTGTLTSGQQTVINLPQFSFTSTSPVVYIELLNVNDTTLFPKTHIKVQQQVVIISSYSTVPLSQGFTATTFPPANWPIVSDDNIKWERHTAGGFGNSPGGSARIRFYDSPNGAVDILYMEGINLTTSSPLQLSFSIAHARYSASYSDNLKVELSTNCGDTWTTLYNKSGDQLATVSSFVTSTFVPTASQWRKEIIDLSGYTSQNEVLIRFKATSGFGNNLYIDDINISDPTGIEDFVSDEFFNVYPNPVNDKLNIEFQISRGSDINIRIYDNTGRMIETLNLGQLASGNHSTEIDASKWSAGMYHAVIQAGDKVITRKVNKN